jgi:hypothetical protein
VHITRITKKYVDVQVAATLRTGGAATLTGIDVAALPPGGKPRADTIWTPAQFTAGVATFLVAGPDANATDALQVPEGGCDIWGRIVDQPEVDVARLVQLIVY